MVAPSLVKDHKGVYMTNFSIFSKIVHDAFQDIAKSALDV